MDPLGKASDFFVLQGFMVLGLGLSDTKRDKVASTRLSWAVRQLQPSKLACKGWYGLLLRNLT